MFVLKAALVSGLAMSVLGFAPGDPCPPGGGNFCASSFSPIILRCGGTGILEPGNCNDNVTDLSPNFYLAGVPPVGVKTDAICGNSTVNNADCFLPPYPPFITVPGNSTTTASSGPTSSSNATTTAPPGNATTSIPIIITKSSSIVHTTVVLGGSTSSHLPVQGSTGAKVSTGVVQFALLIAAVWGFVL